MEENAKKEKTNENEHHTATDMIHLFNRRWEAVVDLFMGLFGLEEEAAKNTILIAIAPLLTAAVQIVNWAYLYVHYHIGYNVPLAYLTVDTSLLTSFGVGVLLMVVFVFICFCLPTFITNIYDLFIVIGFCILPGFFLTFGPNEFEFPGGVFQSGFMCFFLVSAITPFLLTKSDEWTGGKRRFAIGFTAILDALVLLLMFIWWSRGVFADFWAKWGLAQYIKLDIWECISLGVYGAVIVWGYTLAEHSVLRKGAVRVHVGLLFVMVIFLFFMHDDSVSRMSPYAVTENSQQVVVYQSKEISVLEAATITEDEETGYVTLTIDTSQRQIVDSASLSYEYRTFDEVEID